MPVDGASRQPPAWLNAEYYAKALQDSFNEPNLSVQSCDVSTATDPGDHYSSLIFRACLEILKRPSGQPEKLQIVCKVFPAGEVKDFMIEIFEKEAKILMEVMPVINKALENVLPDFRPLCADSIYCTREPNYALGLQDLKEIGMKLADRMNGLNMNGTNLVLKSLAQLHAGSLVVLQNTPEQLQMYERSYWAEPIEDFLPRLVNSGLESLIKAASDWEDFPPENLQKLKGLEGNVVEKLINNSRYDKEYLKVLQHGDCWVNNMMFKGDESNYDDFRFVDFQVSHLNSAGIDLNYFIFTSPAADIRLKNIDEMLKTYYSTFINVAEKLGVDIPSSFSFEQLKKDFRRRAFFGFFATIIVYPITITEKKDVLDSYELIDEKDSGKRQFSTKRFREMFQLVFPYFDECGVFQN